MDQFSHALLRRLDEPLAKENEDPGYEGGSDNQIWENVNALFRAFFLECFCRSALLFVLNFVLVQYSFLRERFLRNMDDLDTSISQMSKESLLKWLKEKFNDDIASKFEGKSY